MCVAIELTASFDTVYHDILISKIARSSLPPAITPWLSCYLRGRQAQGSRLSPSLFNYYMADMPLPTPRSSGFVTLTTSQPKSTVTLFTPDKHQFQTHSDITLEDTRLPLECSPKILGVIMDPSLSFHKHCTYVSDRIN